MTGSDTPPDRVTATDAAIALIGKLKSIHGPLMFHQSGGCCDGSAPMCFPDGEFKTGDQDVLLGEIDGSPFYMGRAQFEYWRHTQLIIDVVDGRGGMFSLEGPEGKRFLTRSRVFSDAEWQALKAAEEKEPIDS
ncbi:DUF779 domain-containing protein [Thalassospira lucentensis]|uniref:DUF779 domain-containing protein n=1 Tax=Thalassospira lucentensis TaxID=168935 RepID=A0A358HZA5_9PROT|nr:DUF779 domain-containing protein [Thalassospira lucentensis]HBV00490.1 DUF779 domain-containing protein [Thalassospira lucentensis]HCW66284.1 DUF779 domain-containing protein [Thalassospira lucentensis]